MILFNSLQREDIHQIIDIELAKLYSRINELGYGIELTEAAKDFIVEKGYDEKFGARPLKRVIQRALQDPLAEMILAGDVDDGAVLPVSAGVDGLIVGGKVATSSLPAPEDAVVH